MSRSRVQFLATLAVGVVVYLVGARGVAAADDLFVSRLGSDDGNNCRTSGAPCRTIAWALNQAQPADTVKVVGGTYRDQIGIVKSHAVAISGGWSTDFVTRDVVQSPTVVRPLRGEGQVAIAIHGRGAQVIDVTLDGLTFTRATEGAADITATDGSSVTVKFTDTHFIRNRNRCSPSCDYAAALSIVVDDTASVNVNISGGKITQNRHAKARLLGTAAAISLYATENAESSATLSLINAVVADNVSGHSYGAPAIRIYNADGRVNNQIRVDLTNVTITRNSGRREYGGIWVGGGGLATVTLNLTNTIVWGNAVRQGPGEGVDLAESEELSTGVLTVNAHHSDMNDVRILTGTLADLGGNVNVDPMFADGGDFHLSSASGLIDAGTDAGLPSTDVDGDPRAVDGDGDGQARADIGADEFVP